MFCFGFVLILPFIPMLDYFTEIPEVWFFLNLINTIALLDGPETVLQLMYNTMKVQGQAMDNLSIFWCNYRWLLIFF